METRPGLWVTGSALEEEELDIQAVCAARNGMRAVAGLAVGNGQDWGCLEVATKVGNIPRSAIAAVARILDSIFSCVSKSDTE